MHGSFTGFPLSQAIRPTEFPRLSCVIPRLMGISGSNTEPVNGASAATERGRPATVRLQRRVGGTTEQLTVCRDKDMTHTLLQTSCARFKFIVVVVMHEVSLHYKYPEFRAVAVYTLLIVLLPRSVAHQWSKGIMGKRTSSRGCCCSTIRDESESQSPFLHHLNLDCGSRDASHCYHVTCPPLPQC